MLSLGPPRDKLVLGGSGLTCGPDDTCVLTGRIDSFPNTCTLGLDAVVANGDGRVEFDPTKATGTYAFDYGMTVTLAYKGATADIVWNA